MLKRLSTMVLAASIAFAVPATSHARSDRYTYLTGDLGGGGALERNVSALETPAGHVAVLGNFEVHPSGTSFAINIDDYGTQDGLGIPVDMWTAAARIFQGCIPVRSTTTITGTTATQPVTVYIGAFEIENPSGCTGIATAGVATVWDVN